MSQKAELENINLKGKEKEIAFRVIAAYRNVQNKQLEIEALKAALERVDWQMKRIKSLVKQGMASVTDFNEANLQLTQAELNLKRQRLLMALKRSEIEYLSGKPLNQWRIP